jgi:hypothetical protein
MWNLLLSSSQVCKVCMRHACGVQRRMYEVTFPEHAAKLGDRRPSPFAPMTSCISTPFTALQCTSTNNADGDCSAGLAAAMRVNCTCCFGNQGNKKSDGVCVSTLASANEEERRKAVTLCMYEKGGKGRGGGDFCLWFNPRVTTTKRQSTSETSALCKLRHLISSIDNWDGKLLSFCLQRLLSTCLPAFAQTACLIGSVLAMRHEIYWSMAPPA